MEEDSNVAFELICFACNIIKEVRIVLNFFLSFVKRYEKKTHNMLSFMLDPKFKSFHLMFSFIGCEQGVAIVEEYDEGFLYPTLLKCYHHLHLVIKSKSEFAD
jgi:uncharacterized protein YktA (UPF0223 family)